MENRQNWPRQNYFKKLVNIKNIMCLQNKNICKPMIWNNSMI